MKRVRQYEFAHRDVPAAFDGCRLAFVSDLHYRSLLKEKGLKDITRLLNDLQVDALLIGGDLHEGCEYVPAVIAALGASESAFRALMPFLETMIMRLVTMIF